MSDAAGPNDKSKSDQNSVPISILFFPIDTSGATTNNSITSISAPVGSPQTLECAILLNASTSTAKSYTLVVPPEANKTNSEALFLPITIPANSDRASTTVTFKGTNGSNLVVNFKLKDATGALINVNGGAFTVNPSSG